MSSFGSDHVLAKWIQIYFIESDFNCFFVHFKKNQNLTFFTIEYRQKEKNPPISELKKNALIVGAYFLFRAHF
jgi:hypothetical protein